MKHVVFLLPNKAGPDKKYRYVQGSNTGLVVQNYYKERVKTKIKRRGNSGEGRERKGECIWRAQSTRLLCKLSQVLFDDCCASLSQNPITIKTRSI